MSAVGLGPEVLLSLLPIANPTLYRQRQISSRDIRFRAHYRHLAPAELLESLHTAGITHLIYSTSAPELDLGLLADLVAWRDALA